MFFKKRIREERPEPALFAHGGQTGPDSASVVSSTATSAQRIPARPAKSLWRRRLILAAIALFSLGGFFHAPLLRAVGQLLQQSDPFPKGDYGLVLLDFPACARNFDQVAAWAGKDREVIYLRNKLSRLMKMGLEKPSGQVEIEQLKLRGLEKAKIWDGQENRYLYQFIPHFEKWLDENPEKSLVVVHGRMSGRFYLRVLSRHLSQEHRKRIFFCPIDSPEFEDSNWYRTKEGQSAFFDGATRVLFDLIFGDGELPGPDWDPQAYEDALP